MKWLDYLIRKLGFKAAEPAQTTHTQIMDLSAAQSRVLLMAEQQVDLSGEPDIHLGQLAQRFWDEGRRDDALRCFTSALVLAPKDGILHLNRANLLYQMGRFHDALVDFDRAAELNPDLPEVAFGNANMIRTLGPDSATLKRLAARRAAQADLNRGKQSLN
jgi:tetratricopeptide (TPR) repeat protein